MNSHEITCPPELDYQNSLALSVMLRDAPCSDQYVFDFSHLKRVEPFGMLLAGSVLRAFMRRQRDANPNVKMQYRGVEDNQSQACSYAAHVGFWRSANIPHGKSLGDARGNHAYLPITQLRVDCLRRRSGERGEHIAETVMDRAHSVARILTQRNDGPLYDSIAYSVREIIRNIIEHSRADKVWICGQYQKINGRTEVAVLDEGIGITETFLRRNMMVDPSDRDAILEAIRPGVTTANRRQQEIDEFSWERQGYGLDPSRYDNEGYGLYLTDCICRQLGKFALVTGSAALERSAARDSWRDCSHRGTGVRIRFNGDGVRDLQQRLDGWVKSAGGTPRHTGSGMSMSSSRRSR